MVLSHAARSLHVLGLGNLSARCGLSPRSGSSVLQAVMSHAALSHAALSQPPCPISRRPTRGAVLTSHRADVILVSMTFGQLSFGSFSSSFYDSGRFSI